LISLVKILKQHGGIRIPGEANLLLEAGNFRALNQYELFLSPVPAVYLAALTIMAFWEVLKKRRKNPAAT
jgi:hypothetical protein